jgi:hypothetical protein
MKFKNRRGPKGKKKEKILHFVSWKDFFFFLAIFHYSFSFALQRRFLELEVMLS